MSYQEKALKLSELINNAAHEAAESGNARPVMQPFEGKWIATPELDVLITLLRSTDAIFVLENMMQQWEIKYA